jgi:protein involved in polysaccharide export with SLBB domain
MKIPQIKALIAVLALFAALLAAQAGGLVTNTASPANSPDESEYHLHSGDIIEVRIYGEDYLTSKVALSERGGIVLPLLATVDVGGKTIAQARDCIRDAYKKDFLVNPVVTVTIVEYGSSKISLMGQVRSPGIYKFPANERLNLLQAIALAGGYTRIGEPSKVTLKRIVNGRVSIIHLNAGAMAEKENSAIVEVQPDDVITVGETIF